MKKNFFLILEEILPFVFFARNKWKKINVVAIPDEEPQLPSFFVPDVQTSLKFVFRDRYKLLLEPIVEVNQQKELLTI